MLKAYVQSWELLKEPEGNKIDYWFCSRPEDAAAWESQQEANNDCVLFDRHHIVVSSSQGGTFICRDFRTEERAPGEFVVYCTGPFIVKESSSGSGSKGESAEAQARELAQKLKPTHRSKNI